MAAALTSVGPSRPDPATGQTYSRALATPEQVLELFNWGPSASAQLTAVHREQARHRLPRAPRQPLTLITDNENITRVPGQAAGRGWPESPAAPQRPTPIHARREWLPL
ncbi:hypothetical protein [Streptomyces lydicus]|uniref:hypothetical protein n=1 Tax=Streptomyces lydicus TaxID=47763 RepID=UPI0037D2F5CB